MTTHDRPAEARFHSGYASLNFDSIHRKSGNILFILPLKPVFTRGG
jgi:hypothetical protein